MHVLTSKRFFAVVFSLAIISAAISTRAADDVANPQYGAWAKFKPGSSATLACDMKVGPNSIDVHVETTKKLTAVTDANVTVESSNKTTYAGHDMTTPAISQTIKATAPAKDVTDKGTADVAAAGKTYTCKVFELTGDAAAANSTKTAGRGPGPNAKATLYVNADVPGGIVKMELTSGDGKTMTFLLTAVDVK